MSIIPERSRIMNEPRLVSGLSALIRTFSIVTLMWGLIILVGLFAFIKFGGPEDFNDSNNYQLNETTELLEKTKRENSELKTLLESYFR